jgi:hypothetical protein
VNHKATTVQRLHELEHRLLEHQCSTPLIDQNRIHLQIYQQLESEKNKILLAEESLWRQRSRATWIKAGDLNTKIFHSFASSSRNKKHIWDITDESGNIHNTQQDIKAATTNYFTNFYKARSEVLFSSQVKVAKLYSQSITAEENSLLLRPCNIQEVLAPLKSFSKDKSPGPDGWTVEFYLHFFDLVGSDLLELVEDSRQHGKILRALNSTFLTLIPKASHPTSFGDFRPIALCNLCYKLISKIIANRIKPILSHLLSREKLGFLKG